MVSELELVKENNCVFNCYLDGEVVKKLMGEEVLVGGDKLDLNFNNFVDEDYVYVLWMLFKIGCVI